MKIPDFKPSKEEQAMLSKMDPQTRALQEFTMQEQQKQLVATTITNIIKMRHDSQMSVANNLKG